MKSLARFALTSFVVVTMVASTAIAQLGGKSVSEDAGPVSETSRGLSDDSKPVHESGRTTHESSVGTLSGNSTRESAVGPMKSGSLSDISAGTVTSNRSLRREKAEARLAPAPPRIVWEETVDAPVEWQPYYDLDALVDAISAIQPIARAELPPNDEGASEPADERDTQFGD